MDIKRLFKSWVLIALGVVIASHTSSGIHYNDVQALLIAVLLLSVCNLVLKPLLMLFSLPFIILTFGVGIWLINAVLFLLVGHLVSGFYVDSYGYALWGALVVSITGGVASLLFGPKKGRVNIQVNRGGTGMRSAGPGARPNQPQKNLSDDDDVIDI